jgi:nitrate reductase NapD
MKRDAWNRREFLQTRQKSRDDSALGETHISSAVISVLPAERERVLQTLKRLPDVEIHHSNTSKIVIVMEAPESGLLGSRLAEISAWPGVLSANMVFEQITEAADIGD